MEKFIAEQNVHRFVNLLETETDADRRRIVASLLIDQEDRFGSRCERLAQTSRFMTELEERIARQREIVLQHADNPGRAQLAEQRLANMLNTLGLLEEYKRHLLDGVERDSPGSTMFLPE